MRANRLHESVRVAGAPALLAILSLASPAGAVGQAPADQEPLRIAVIADINASYGTVGYGPAVSTAIRRIVELKPDLVIGVGDLIAGQKTGPKLDRNRLEAMWRAFREEVGGPLARAGIPFAPVPGNHDASALPGFELEREIFREEWEALDPDLAFVGTGAGYPFRYAFDLGDVRFVVLDATTVGPLSAEQKRWLGEELGRTPIPRASVVAAHLPIRAVAQGREWEVLGDAELEAILRETEVDLFLSGHHHAYYPAFVGGVLQVSQGCLGSGPRRLIGESRRSDRSFTIVDIAPDGIVRVRALAGPAFDEAIDPASLPEAIEHRGITLRREDLVRPRRSLEPQ